jgi:hypothetical protein
MAHSRVYYYRVNRVAICHRSGETLKNEYTNTLASPVTSATIIKCITFSVFVGELAIAVSIERKAGITRNTYDMAMDWSGDNSN